MVVIPVYFRGREIIRMSLSLAFWCRLESWCTCDAATAPDIIGCLLHQHGTVNSCARATTGLDASGMRKLSLTLRTRLRSHHVTARKLMVARRAEDGDMRRPNSTLHCQSVVVP